MTLTVRYGDPASVGTDPNRLSTAGPLERAWEICDIRPKGQAGSLLFVPGHAMHTWTSFPQGDVYPAG